MMLHASRGIFAQKQGEVYVAGYRLLLVFLITDVRKQVLSIAHVQFSPGFDQYWLWPLSVLSFLFWLPGIPGLPFSLRTEASRTRREGFLWSAIFSDPVHQMLSLLPEEGGIWGRWSEYARTKHGGNKRLIALITVDPEYCSHFQYFILEVFPIKRDRKEVLEYEQLYKKKLRSVQFGLNDN